MGLDSTSMILAPKLHQNDGPKVAPSALGPKTNLSLVVSIRIFLKVSSHNLRKIPRLENGRKEWISSTLRLHGMSWGVKTTCFKAPGVSLGGSGVSIGGVRSLRVGFKILKIL